MTNPFKYLAHHKVVMGAIIAIVVLITAVVSRLGGPKADTAETTQETRIGVIALKDYQQDLGFVSASGSVEALDQAEIRSQVSAPVSRVNVSVGTQVGAGQVLITADNRDIAAQLAQAQAGLKSQEARLDELRKGLRNEELALAQSQLNQAKQALEDTKQQSDLAIKNAQLNLFNSGLQAIPNPTNVTKPTVTITGTYTGTQMGSYIIRTYNSGGGARFFASGLENADGPIVTTAPEKLGKLGLFIQFSTTSVVTDDFWTVSVPNTSSPTYTMNKSAYDSALQNRTNAINAAQSALDAAQKGYDLKIAGASDEQIRIQQAAVDQARASVQAASAQYDKTIIRSPISGTVSAITVKYGELLSPGVSVATVVSQGGLQVKTYVSESDRQLLADDAEADLGNGVVGKVVRMSPSVDQATKGVEVQIAVIDPSKSGLTVGQNAQVKIKTKTGGANTVGFRLPIQAVNISQNGAAVFLVKDGVLEEHKVEIGAVAGEQVEIRSGLTSDMTIASTVYELKNGQKVVVQ